MVRKNKVLKVLITGSFGSGKTTLIRSLSEIDPLLTEKKISSQSGEETDKKTTTVAMDMGKILLEDGREVHLYATPGQERFEFMLDILKRGIAGALILIDATNPQSVEDAKRFASRLREDFHIPILFGVTKVDQSHPEVLKEIRKNLNGLGNLPLVVLDPRNREEGIKALKTLLGELQK